MRPVRFWLPIFGLVLLTAVSAAVAIEILENEPTTLVYPPFWHTPFGIHRGTPEWLAFFLGRRTRFLDPEGLACARLLSEIATAGDQQDCRVSLIGANTGLGHLIYNPSMLKLDVLGDRGPTAGLFERPQGVALAPDGTAYVADPARRRVVRLRLRQGALEPAGELPAPDGGWRAPWGVAVDSQGRIYCSDAGLNLVLVYSAQGQLVRTLGPQISEGIRLQSPGALAVTDPGEVWSFYHDRYLFVCDRQGRRILRLDPEEPQVRIQAWTDTALLPGAPAPARFAWLALDYFDQLWVTDPVRHQVHKFDRHLQYLASFGREGNGDGRFLRPSGIAIYRHFGQVFVAESQGAHYFWIGTDMLNPQARWAQPEQFMAEVRFFLTEPSFLDVDARTAQGKTFPVIRRHVLLPGPQSLVWQMPLAARNQDLVLEVTAEATYSSAQYLAKRVRLDLLAPKP